LRERDPVSSSQKSLLVSITNISWSVIAEVYYFVRLDAVTVTGCCVVPTEFVFTDCGKNGELQNSERAGDIQRVAEASLALFFFLIF